MHPRLKKNSNRERFVLNHPEKQKKINIKIFSSSKKEAYK
jgi:hypothetical protein